MHSYIYKIHNRVRLGRKKIMLPGTTNVDECLYLWFLEKQTEDIMLFTLILQAQTLNFHKELNNKYKFMASIKHVLYHRAGKSISPKQ